MKTTGPRSRNGLGRGVLGHGIHDRKLRFADLVTRFYYPSLTIDRHWINYKFDLDFNLPGDWYLRMGSREFGQSAAIGLPRNDYGWSNSSASNSEHAAHVSSPHSRFTRQDVLGWLALPAARLDT
jgi:hypothetical protein